MSNRLTIGPEGFVDLRRNPPADNDVVNGWTPENGQPAPVVEAVSVPPKTEPEVLPGRQKGTEGLNGAEFPVLAPVAQKPRGLVRIDSSSGVECYILVTPTQFEKLGKFKWIGVRQGRLYRIDEKGKPRWAHREAARVFRHDRFVAFLSGDERNCTPSNLRVVTSKEKAKEITRNGMLNAAGK
jgi:hypothetical protein